MERRCPCCGYYTLQNEDESLYAICPVCFWENDPWQAAEPDEAGGANSISLRSAQRNFAEFAACEEQFVSNVRRPYGNERYAIVSIADIPERMDEAAYWFHEKWGVPKEAYLESMADGLSSTCGYPAWYVAINREDRIVGGTGIIENDFHVRKDLKPNVCAVFVEPEYRCLGIAGRLLQTACEGLKKSGLERAYLVTEHEAFYERYGWSFLCMVEEDEGGETRMYVKEL